jgi:hypothetical protein
MAMLPSHTSNGATTNGRIGCGKFVQPLSSEHRGVVTL